MEPPGRCGDWLAPPPSPPRAHAPGRHDERGVRTSNWPPAGTYIWPSAGTFPWPWTPVAVRAAETTSPSQGVAMQRAGGAILAIILSFAAVGLGLLFSTPLA